MNIDIEVLKDYKLTPNEYVVAHTVQNKNYKDFRALSKLIQMDDILRSLEKKGFIKVPEEEGISLDDITVRNKLLFVFDERDYFDDIYEEYPVKVIRPDGVKDYLRADVKRSRKIYYNKVNSSRKRHEKILKALRFEKEIREKENSWKYMKKLPKWLSSEEWKVFEERMRDEQQEKSNKKPEYGQQLK